MLPMKIKTEKPDVEAVSARSRLEAVLQGLVEKSDSEREQNEEDSGKMGADSLSKDLSPSSAGKRPSSRLPQHRRKKRKEMDDGLAESSQHKPNTYIIKLFDRSVDLAQFTSSTPLYPICRAWMRNNPSVRERAGSPSPPPSLVEEEVADMLNGTGTNVYRLPPPTPCAVAAHREPISLRIPPIEKAPVSEVSPAVLGRQMGAPLSGGRYEVCATPPAPSALMFNHMEHWKRVRQKWKEASGRNQLRYSESIKVLKEMYER
ncbi:protein lin-37 homolog isoform X1 [Lepisosteus oculatus]|uniref:protein lin-37 homolog isoform X1 n=1 Tax=Lepisosteus oculatus TaxID=7918 RepID=UPI00073FD765|nr:PREDICTED: protein lin-37 homolog isoform X1 [Lepisosteus oculatus]XP_015191881.1 PREDICTED: protein lin-37 homolog isoform X1 [Lepisosteus oculatus]